MGLALAIAPNLLKAPRVSGYFSQTGSSYTQSMTSRLTDTSGTVMTASAGALLAVLSVSAFGAAPTLFGFVALFLLAATTHRAISRHR